MKANKGDLTTENLTDTETSVVEASILKQQGNLVILNLLPVFAMAFFILFALIKNMNGIDLLKLSILILILTTATVFFIRWNAFAFIKQRLMVYLVVIGYLLCIGMILLIPKPEIYSFWMLGGLLISMKIDNRLGLIFHVNMTLLLGIMLSLRIEIVIQLLVISILLCLLAGFMMKKDTVIYAAIIILSTNITLSFIINNFVYEISKTQNYFSSLFSILGVIVIAFFTNELLGRVIPNNVLNQTDFLSNNEIVLNNEIVSNNGKVSNDVKVSNYEQLDNDKLSENDKLDDKLSNDKLSENDKISVNEISSDNDMDVTKDQNQTDTLSIDSTNMKEEVSAASHLMNRALRTSYDVLNEENNGLLSSLKEFSQSIYEHSILIGDLSCRAARLIGADETLAKAGGLYHDIGKMKGKNYIEEGLKIAEDYAFPKELMAIMKQHNIKYEKPNSVEAAIVMLSDNVVSTLEYIDKIEDQKFTNSKIIDHIFQMRLEKGTFDNTGLSVKDFKVLKEFYQQEFQKVK